jgi:hypothetical protein
VPRETLIPRSSIRPTFESPLLKLVFDLSFTSVHVRDRGEENVRRTVGDTGFTVFDELEF